MRLRDLEAVFLRREVRDEERTFIKPEIWAVRKDGPWTDSDIMTGIRPCVFHVPVETLDAADGIEFLCPKCFAACGGKIGCHMVICWFENKVSDDAEPKPGRWWPTGTGLDALSFVPHSHSNSVLLLGGCGWHGFVTLGDAT